MVRLRVGGKVSSTQLESTEHASEVMMEKIIIISHAVKYTTN